MLSQEKCIGCGLCVTICPEEIIALEDKPEVKMPFKDYREMLTSDAKERGMKWHQA